LFGKTDGPTPAQSGATPTPSIDTEIRGPGLLPVQTPEGMATPFHRCFIFPLATTPFHIVAGCFNE
jgi:hypothetical protein